MGAQEVARELLAIEPSFQISTFVSWYPLEQADDLARLQRALRIAGLPEVAGLSFHQKGYFCNGRRLSIPLLRYPIAGHLLLYRGGAGSGAGAGVGGVAPWELRYRPWALDFTPDDAGTRPFPHDEIVNPYYGERPLEWTTDDWDPALRFWTLTYDPNSPSR